PGEDQNKCAKQLRSIFHATFTSGKFRQEPKNKQQSAATCDSYREPTLQMSVENVSGNSTWQKLFWHVFALVPELRCQKLQSDELPKTLKNYPTV
ncbi:MAG TPA: hypothetical protein VN872_01955, partial [Candidatus Acidoferrum sp.]|nr:hypothetical protein [Candidatus Acidoferrum sp.]